MGYAHSDSCTSRQFDLSRLDSHRGRWARNERCCVARRGTIEALTFVVVYEITQDGLAPLLRERPAIDEELGSVRLVHDHELGAKPPPA